MTGQNDARGTPDDPWISVAVALITLRIPMETESFVFCQSRRFEAFNEPELIF